MQQEREKFEAEVYKATKKVLGVDYGFILGTKSPLMERDMDNGFFSANAKGGFEIWKRHESGIETKILNPKSYNDSFEQIVKFLKRK